MWNEGNRVSDQPPRIVVKSVETLSKNWGTLTRHTFDYRRADGRIEQQSREVYDRGNGATIIPYDKQRGTVLLVRQCRFAAYVTGHEQPLIEACAGLLDADDPETAIRREAEEELGYRLRDVKFLISPFMTQGSVTERLWFFTAHYTPDDRVSAGGGHEGEGEDIEVLEMPLDQALEAVSNGSIVDGKTIILLQHLELERFRGR